MAIESKKAKDLDVFIASHPNCAKGKQKIVIDGKVNLLESYLLPIPMLQYNHENRRFNLEIQEYEQKIGRHLDPLDKDDVKIIKELLLQDQSEARKLFDDLKKVGEQTDVGAISFDGIVINGNRRMATLELLHEEEPTGKWNSLWVVRLPKEISEKDLWRIEAGLQLSKEKVADYGPINNLLMINEGRRAGLEPSEIAASMYGWTEKQVLFDLERLKLINSFLEFMNQPLNYGLIKKFRLHEHFIDIQKGLLEKQKSLGITNREMTKMLENVFLYLRTHIIKPDINITHWDVRSLCKILQDPEATYSLVESFDKYDDKRKVPAEVLMDNFDRALDVKKNREDKAKPSKLIDRAIAALNSIDKKSSHYKADSGVKIKIKELNLLVKEIMNDLGVQI